MPFARSLFAAFCFVISSLILALALACSLCAANNLASKSIFCFKSFSFSFKTA